MGVDTDRREEDFDCIGRVALRDFLLAANVASGEAANVASDQAANVAPGEAANVAPDDAANVAPALCRPRAAPRLSADCVGALTPGPARQAHWSP